jgi:hypothetical protein
VAGWFGSLFRAFIEFRPAHNWKCRFHDGAHYQDEIVVQDGASEWYLHNHLIARLRPIEHPVYELYLTDAGYPTVTTLSRLNGILWLFKLKLDIDLGVQFHLKYNGVPGYPVYTYIEYKGLDYLANGVNIVFNILFKRASVDIQGRAIMHFMKHRELSYVRKLYYKLREIKSQLDDALNRLIDLVHNLDIEPPISLAQRIYEFRDTYYKVINELGLPYGIYVAHVEDAKDTLKSLLREGEELLTRAKEIITELTLLSA